MKIAIATTLCIFITLGTLLIWLVVRFKKGQQAAKMQWCQACIQKMGNVADWTMIKA